jgi:cysteinyl-tRNA synthetase
MLKIYNSFSQKKEDFVPIVRGKIKIYVCGPTVYDFCHIGNARTYTAFDAIIRYLRYQKYDVEYARNITDIDDKIINRAAELNVSVGEIVERYTAAMHADFDALGLARPEHEPTATGFIEQIISLIQTLIENDSAYLAANGDVYYSVTGFAHYGKLSHRDIDKLLSGARVEINEVKNNPLDFVLWKMAKPGEPAWGSPWGEGRPGWHIECSAMVQHVLGDQIDIHGGGKDLIFPHHENEIAQTEAVTQKTFVNTWMHAGYLQIDKDKMSKSLGNFFTIRELLLQHPAEVLRYFLLSSHYRSALQYSEQNILQARNSLERLYTCMKGLESAAPIEASEYENKFISAMDDDFNTPIALSVLFELAHEIQRLKLSDIAAAAKHGALLKKLGNVLGFLSDEPLKFLQRGVEGVTIDSDKVAKMIDARNAARLNKNWAEADRIRDELLGMSIILEDTADGTSWTLQQH